MRRDRIFAMQQRRNHGQRAALYLALRWRDRRQYKAFLMRIRLLELWRRTDNQSVSAQR
jgi:hypothetical protein